MPSTKPLNSPDIQNRYIPRPDRHPGGDHGCLALSEYKIAFVQRMPAKAEERNLRVIEVNLGTETPLADGTFDLIEAFEAIRAEVDLVLA